MVSDWEDEEESTRVYEPGAFHASLRPQVREADEERWFISPDGRTKETLAAKEIIERVQRGAFSGQALVWRDGLSDWTPLEQVPELMQAIRAFQSAGPASALPPPPAPQLAPPPVAAAWSAAPSSAAPPAPSLPPAPRPPPSVLPAPAAPPSLAAPPSFPAPPSLAAPLPAPSLPPPPPAGLAGQGAAPLPPASLPPPAPAMHVNPLTSQPVISAAHPAAPEGRVFDLPWVGPVSARFLVATAVMLFAGVGLGTLVFSGEDEPAAGDSPAVAQYNLDELEPTKPAAEPPEAAEPTEDEAEDAREAKAAEDEPAEARDQVASLSDLARADDAESEPRAAPASRAVHSAAARRSESRSATPERAERPAPSPSPAPAPAANPSPPAEEPAGPAFNLAAVKSALTAAAAKASRCRPAGGPTGSGSVQVVFQPSGSVSSVSVVTPKFHGTTTETCVKMVFRRANVPAFGGGPKTVAKSFNIP